MKKIILAIVLLVVFQPVLAQDPPADPNLADHYFGENHDVLRIINNTDCDLDFQLTLYGVEYGPGGGPLGYQLGPNISVPNNDNEIKTLSYVNSNWFTPGITNWWNLVFAVTKIGIRTTGGGAFISQYTNPTGGSVLRYNIPGCGCIEVTYDFHYGPNYPLNKQVDYVSITVNEC